MKSIVYKPLITRGDLAADTTSGLNISSDSSSPTFKYTGYKPQYNGRAPADSSTESATTATPETAVTPEDPEVDQQIEWEDPSTINGGTTPATVTQAQQQSTTTPVQHVFKTPGMDVGEMQEFLDTLAKAGIAVRVTSGTRPGAKTSNGRQSNHAIGRALDITPVEGQTFEDLAKKIRNSPDLIKYMKDNRYGIYDETSQEILKNTNGTGAHGHIGPDQVAISGLETILMGRSGLKIPIILTQNKIL